MSKGALNRLRPLVEGEPGRMLGADRSQSVGDDSLAIEKLAGL